MLDLGELRDTLNEADSGMKKNIGHLGTLAKDAKRVSKIAINASSVINNLDYKFEQAVGLTGLDVSFLFLATALQVVRQYFFTNFKERLGHNEAAKDSKKTEENVLGKETEDEKEERKNSTHWWYRPSIEEVTFNPVPFDQTTGLEGIGGAFEHRAKTPGHDAILGYIVGTANIATATLTPWHGLVDDCSYHVKYEMQGEKLKPAVTNEALTHKVFSKTYERFKEGGLGKEGLENKAILAISLFREHMHLKSDINSKVSLPLPIITTISPDIAKMLAKYGFDLANVKTVGKQIAYATFINTIIAILHRLIYDNNNPGNILHYEIRTRKILSYSNLIASASNVLIVSLAGVIGAKTENDKMVDWALKNIDIGGLLVTLHRLISDSIFISEIKQEFLEKEFHKIVMGEDFSF